MNCSGCNRSKFHFLFFSLVNTFWTVATSLYALTQVKIHMWIPAGCRRERESMHCEKGRETGWFRSVFFTTNFKRFLQEEFPVEKGQVHNSEVSVGNSNFVICNVCYMRAGCIILVFFWWQVSGAFTVSFWKVSIFLWAEFHVIIIKVNIFTSGAWKDQFGMWFSWTTTVPSRWSFWLQTCTCVHT